ncbi:MAG: hypothetical protein ACMXYK_03150 [Candidatus Woesearchaeota archaeon]
MVTIHKLYTVLKHNQIPPNDAILDQQEYFIHIQHILEMLENKGAKQKKEQDTSLDTLVTILQETVESSHDKDFHTKNFLQCTSAITYQATLENPQEEYILFRYHLHKSIALKEESPINKRNHYKIALGLLEQLPNTDLEQSKVALLIAAASPDYEAQEMLCHAAHMLAHIQEKSIEKTYMQAKIETLKISWFNAEPYMLHHILDYAKEQIETLDEHEKKIYTTRFSDLKQELSNIK